MSHYPKNISLTKLNTLPNALQPQREKYSNGTVREGLMWKHSVPKIGEHFFVLIDKLNASFMTSQVVEILHDTPEEVIFKTYNSTYRLLTL